jgi:hypothetical protein
VPREATTHAIVTLTSDKDVEGRIGCELLFEGALARISSLRFQPIHAATIDRFVATDALGDIDVRTRHEPSGTSFDLGRFASGPLTIRYSVTFGAPSGDDGPMVEPIEFRVSGEDVFALPDVEERFPIVLRLRTGGSSIDAASSFGLGIEQRTSARASDLRRASFLAGDVGTAAFHTDDGDDIGAWLGYTAFDPRWVSAEIAGVRSNIDVWMGRQPSAGAPPLATLFTSVKRDEPPVVVQSRTRGLLISVDRRAIWSANPRILVAQALTQRYIGGFLWVGDRRDEASGAFFSTGYSRAIAREILFEGGEIDHVDRAAEVNMLLAATVFSDEPAKLATARGALSATALDVAIRKATSGQGSLRFFIRQRLAEAANEKRDTLPLPELVALVRASAGEARARVFEAELAGQREIPLPADLLGPCYRLESKLLVPFELGFVTTTGETLEVASVTRGSRAEAAGVRVGDVVSDLRYEAGRASVPVTMTVTRGGASTKLRFTPTGRGKPGRIFERVPGIPNERCVPTFGS